jgi:hypothetical protein
MHLIQHHDAILIGLIGLAVVTLYYAVLVMFSGRHRNAAEESVVEPPDGISPTAMRYIRQGTSFSKTHKTAVVAMASHGILRVEETNEGYILTRTIADYRMLPAEEREFAKVVLQP